MGVLGDVLNSVGSAVSDAVNSVLGIGGGGGNDNDSQLANAIKALQRENRLTGGVIDDVFAQAADQAAVGTVEAIAAGGDLRNAIQDVKFSIEHTYKTVIPHSMAWLKGDIVRLYITPLRSRVGKLENRVTALETWRADIHKWRIGVVDPTLADFHSFKRFWQSWPLDVVTQFRQWINKPDTFATYFTPVIVPRAIAYLGNDANLPLLDALLTELVDASPDRYRHVVAAFETMLDLEWP